MHEPAPLGALGDLTRQAWNPGTAGPRVSSPPPMVGISLLTLVPGVVGGQETYVRELTRTLARVGELDYRVFVPTIAPDVADGLPSREVTAYRASTSMSGRMAAMSLAAALPAPGAARARAFVTRCRTLPADGDAPARAAPSCGDEHARRPALLLPALLLAGGVGLSRGRLSLDGAPKPAADHRHRAREGDARGAARRRARPRARDPVRHRPRSASARMAASGSHSCSTRPTRGHTRTTRACSRRSSSCTRRGRSYGSC